MSNAKQRRQYWRLVRRYILTHNEAPLTMTMRGLRIYDDAEEHAAKVMQQKAGAK